MVLDSLLWLLKDPERLHYVDAINGGFFETIYQCNTHRNYCAHVALCFHSRVMCVE